ncbi:MAG: hypothetical protein UT33_C0006G0030 [Candidatus Peregrinibacteria bacterium GW2011_GWC2_39_14]|nr:MAG: hypothetical protein UT33_C0006G0030 [Candidatus Peregrinibacteria bacterium GW2011_GWC2_39_14]
MNPSNMKKYVSIFLAFSMIFALSGCRAKEGQQAYVPPKKVVLTYYKMNDSIDVMKPFFDEFKALPGNQLVEINYVQFTDLKKYEDRILNELAEGGGPDIFSMPNTWITKHQKKINPMSPTIMTIETFKNTFVYVAEKDLIRPFTDAAGVKTLQIYGLPMFVDSLAVYYNKAHFLDKIPERGKPAVTWSGLLQDVAKLTKSNNSAERFEVSGAALGRADNINNAIEILYALMLQYETKFYNENYTASTIATQQGMDADNNPKAPGLSALNLYVSFADSTKANYSWNQYIAQSVGFDKEIDAFARGKVSMIFGFSDYYQKISDKIKELKGKNQLVMDPAFVQIGQLPQVEDPALSTKKPTTLASYYAETVSRNSKYPKESWNLIQFLITKKNLQAYNSKTHKPTSRLDLIPEQKADAVYAAFAYQTGVADSVLVLDYDYYKNAIASSIQAVVGGARLDISLKSAEAAITSILPEKGLTPPGPYVLKNQPNQQKPAITPAK